MSKCAKVKNPCKLCFRSVSTKTGVQCRGVCKKWAHFKCLNYSPGNIQDIKSGILRISCPCPDCNKSEQRETMADSPYTCTNFQCPANSLPHCESTDCPSLYHIKKMPIITEPCRSSFANLRCPVKRRDHVPPTPIAWAPESSSYTNVVDSCTNPCPPQPRNPAPICKPRVCPPVKQLCSKVQDKMCSPIRSFSCSYVANDSCHTDIYRKWSKRQFKNIGCDTEMEERISTRYVSSSDSQLNKASHDTQKSLYCTMEQMCTTVGELSGQLKELMCRMMEAFEKTCT